MPDYAQAERLLDRAHQEGRTRLYEHEVYEFLEACGIGRSPRLVFWKNSEFGSPLSVPWKGPCVYKVVHPDIIHKSDVGGVRFGAVEDGPKIIHEMMKGLRADQRTGVLGVLVVERIAAPTGLGKELFLGVRQTTEFGPVITMGVGGLSTELFAKATQRNESAVSQSPGLSQSFRLAETFEAALGGQMLTGTGRGFEAVTRSETLRDLVSKFAGVARQFSSLNPKARFHLVEFEVNPFLFEKEVPRPVDGVLQFKPMEADPSLGLKDLKPLLYAKTASVIGVSGKGRNVGRLILQNLLAGIFKPESLAIVKKDEVEVDGVRCFPSIRELPQPVDLLVLTIPASQVPETLREAIESKKVRSVLIPTGGMAEREEGRSIEAEIEKLVLVPSTPAVLGGNSLGIISRPGGYDTLFISPDKLPRRSEQPLGKNLALVSQSGAFMISRMSSWNGAVPRFVVSTGNEVDVSSADLLTTFAGDSDLDVIGCYVEGFKRGRGLQFARAVETARKNGKRVIVYKAGKTAEGQKAASGHTASLAGDWEVARSVLTQAGAVVVETFEEWSDAVMLAALMGRRSLGKGRMAAVSNAGYETVGIADALGGKGTAISLTKLQPQTTSKLQEVLKEFRLSELQDIRNPMDLTPMASDEAHSRVAEILLQADEVDLLLHACVPLTDAIQTSPDHVASLAHSFAVLQKKTKKPFLVVIDSGALYDPLADRLLTSGIPVFRSVSRAVRAIQQLF